MRHLAAPFLISTVLLGAACANEGPWSPSDPKSLDRSMVNTDALSGLSADDQAYVMGHAIGVYLMGKTLPSRVADHGYLYHPGRSTLTAKVPYNWIRVLKIRSGGSDGNGGIIFDDVGMPDPREGDSYYSDPGDPNVTPPGAPSDDVGTGDTGSGDPGDPDNPPDGDGGGDHNGCGVIDKACSHFMNPSAFDAQGLADQVDPAKFADLGVTGPALDRFTDVFRGAMEEALSVEGIDDFVADSEVVATSNEVVEQGYCEY
jgi:hypothetical protein